MKEGYQLPIMPEITIESDGLSGPFVVRCETDGVDLFKSKDDGMPATLGAKLAVADHIRGSGHKNHYITKKATTT